MLTQELHLTCITSDGRGPSEFTKTTIQLTGEQSRRLSEPIDAVNFRLRTSASDYRSGFHVAGDPTLLIILSGCLTVRLVSGESQSFSSGEMFIAQDYLEAGVEFEQGVHGHMAEASGDLPLTALHLKLNKR